MRTRAIQSELYSSANDFTIETYCLHKNGQLREFLSQPNEGYWIVKNMSPQEQDTTISLVSDVATFKKNLLLKIKRGAREKLQALIGTNTSGNRTAASFSDSDDDDGDEERKIPATPARLSMPKTPARKRTASMLGTPKPKSAAAR